MTGRSPGSLRPLLRRRGALGVVERLGSTYWSIVSRFWLAPQFAAFGRGTVIRRPMLIRNPGGISIGHGGSLRPGCRLEVVDRSVDRRGAIRIGNGVSFEQNVHIAAADLVEIGDLVCIAANCVIVDTAHPERIGGDSNPAALLAEDAAPVTIGRRVFLGAGTVVLRGVEIGENTVVGANSVVSRSLPANAVAAGAPARVLRMIG